MISLSVIPRPARKSSPVPVAIIGVSGYASVLLECLQPLVKRNEIQIVAANVRNRLKAKTRCESIEQAGGRIYKDWKTMLDDEKKNIDLVIIPTAIHVHKDMAVYALERNINVFLEKPIAATVEDAEAIIASAMASEAGIAIGYQDLYEPANTAIKKLILEGEIGELQAIRGICMWPRGMDYYTRNSWAGKMRVGEDLILDSPLNNAMAHFINLPLYWAGKEVDAPACVASVRGSTYRAHKIESFDTASIEILTDRDIPIHFHGTHSCMREVPPKIICEGNEGSITWEMDKGYTVENARHSSFFPYPPQPLSGNPCS